MRSSPLPAGPAGVGAPPRVPDDMRVYAIGDIHGRLDLLTLLQREMDADAARHPHRRPQEIYLGDYVDRGADSAGVLDALMARVREKGAICLLGNHEELMLESLVSADAFSRWLRMGAFEAVRSYLGGAVPDLEMQGLWRQWRAAMRPEHVAFLRSLPLTRLCGDYLFVHAGVRPGVPLARQNREDLLWIRRLFLDDPRPFEHFVVHGHTPVPEVEVRPNRIDIDTGAWSSGHLTCLVLDGETRSLIAT